MNIKDRLQTFYRGSPPLIVYFVGVCGVEPLSVESHMCAGLFGTHYISLHICRLPLPSPHSPASLKLQLSDLRRRLC